MQVVVDDLDGNPNKRSKKNKRKATETKDEKEKEKPIKKTRSKKGKVQQKADSESDAEEEEEEEETTQEISDDTEAEKPDFGNLDLSSKLKELDSLLKSQPKTKGKGKRTKATPTANPGTSKQKGRARGKKTASSDIADHAYPTSSASSDQNGLSGSYLEIDDDGTSIRRSKRLSKSKKNVSEPVETIDLISAPPLILPGVVSTIDLI